MVGPYKSLLLPLLGIILLASSCGHPSTDLTVTFLLKYDGEPLVMTEDYQYPDGQVIRFNRISFYISDLTVQDGDESVVASPVEYINPTESHLTRADAEKGLIIDMGSVALNKIDALSFNLGLPSSINSTTPNEHSSNSPLALTGEYWEGWSSFIFFKIEGFVDLDGDDIPEKGIALHVGSDHAMRHISLSGNDGDGNISLSVDVKKIFSAQGQNFDIGTHSQIHSLHQLDQINALADNFSQSVSME